MELPATAASPAADVVILPTNQETNVQASEATCHRCQGKGHFSTMCFTKLPAQQADVNFAFLDELNNHDQSSWKVTLHIGKTPIEFKIDTGAAVHRHHRNYVQRVRPTRSDQAQQGAVWSRTGESGGLGSPGSPGSLPTEDCKDEAICREGIEEQPPGTTSNHRLTTSREDVLSGSIRPFRNNIRYLRG